MGFGYGHKTSHNGKAFDRETGERVKTIFSNDMAAHVWAQRSQTFGQSSNGNLYFEDDAIYSYGSHFLVAYLLDTGAEVVALLNSDSYSTTTGGHKGDARGASSHFTQYSVPHLTALREVLPTLAEYPGKPAALRRAAATDDGWRAKQARRAVAEWLGSFDIAEDSEVTSRDGSYSWTQHGNAPGARAIAKAAGFSDSDVARIQRERGKKVAAAKLADERRERERDLREAKYLAGMSDSDFRAKWPNDGNETQRAGQSKPWPVKEGEQFSARLLRLQKAAKAKGWTRVAAILSARRKAYREHFAGRDDRIMSAFRRGLAAEVRHWRAGGARPAKAYRFPAAIKTAIERAEQIELREQRAANFAAWQAGTERRPPASYYAEGSPERAAVEADESAEKARNESLFLAWQADNSQPRPPARAFLSSLDYSPKTDDGRYDFNLSGDELAAYRRRYPFSNAYQLLTQAEATEKRERAEAERAEAIRLQQAEESERREAWLAGSTAVRWSGDDGNGGALLRVRGDQLETSQGASVPLAHAIKAFRFVKLCRERGESWERNGKLIRVGHFQLDSIDSAGNFRAGCHRFNWPEIERVAGIAGVADAAPSAEAVELKESV